MLGLKYHDGSPMTDHLNNFQEMDIKFEEEIQGLLLLGSLPDSWETFRTSLSNYVPDGMISMNFAKNSVLNEEMRRKSQGSSSPDVLVTDAKGRRKNHCAQNNEHHRSKSRDKSKNIESHHCGLKGHTKKFCWKLKKQKRDKEKKKEYDNENCVVTVTTKDLVAVLDANLVNVACDESSWVMDSSIIIFIYFSYYSATIIVVIPGLPNKLVVGK
ncbi:hypothetical protein FXO38_01727 [Capsicum annuum]|nr:hypothetical protein FXO38_01727 [Capsicum annuum]